MIKYILPCILIFTFGVSSADAGVKYKKILKKWTRSDKVYRIQDLAASIQWKATLLKDHVLQAQADHYASIYEASDEDRSAKFQELQKRKGSGILFFVSFYSGERPFDRLIDKRAHWDLRLLAGDKVLKPDRIETIGKRPDPLDILFYPYLHNWSQGYYVWFKSEVDSLPKPWILSVHGFDSKSKLVWK